MIELLTIGYEAAAIEDFIATLRSSRVQKIIDVRALPLSRRRGFSKTALQQHLISNEIQYVHIGSLGDPKDGRLAARAGEYETFRKIYRAHLRTKDAQEGLQLTATLAGNFRICLLCYEKSPELCHRTLIADALSKIRPFSVKHLTVRPREEELVVRVTERPRRKSANSRKGSPTTQPTTW